MTKYIILDWAGNRCLSNHEFDTFEDAWDAIYIKFKHLNDTEFDIELGEYEVVEVTIK